MLAKLEPKGIIGLPYLGNGFEVRGEYKPLHQVVTFKGLKMRKFGIQERALRSGSTCQNCRRRAHARSIDALEVFANDRLLRSVDSRLLHASPLSRGYRANIDSIHSGTVIGSAHPRTGGRKREFLLQ